MDATHIITKFEKLGARANIRPRVQNRWQPAPSAVVIDVRHDRHGEFFDIQAGGEAEVEVLDVQPKDRHLLLMVRRPNQRPGLPDAKDKFLCGHDERHWFVAAVPEKAPVSSVVTAKEALKPDLVREREQGKKGKRQMRLRRKTDVFVYVRGKITHPDHATIRLDGWHRVEMNTENRSRAMASVVFLD